MVEKLSVYFNVLSSYGSHRTLRAKTLQFKLRVYNIILEITTVVM